MNLTPANLTKRYGYWLADVILCELLLTITFAEKSSSESGAVLGVWPNRYKCLSRQIGPLKNLVRTAIKI